MNFTGLWDGFLAEGRSTFTVEDVKARTGASVDAVYSAVKYARDRGRLFSPVRGLYVIVPVEHRARGVVPAAHFVDPMLGHLGVGYYVGYASAAQWWGAARHAPQQFDVVVSRHVGDRDLSGVRLRFHTSTRIDADEVRRVAGPRTMVNVASPNLTAVDLATRPGLVGGLSNVATILAELPDLDGDRLGLLAGRRSRSVARRLGWILALVRSDLDLSAIEALARPDDGQPTLLAGNSGRRGQVDQRWGVLVNTSVEPDAALRDLAAVTARRRAEREAVETVLPLPTVRDVRRDAMAEFVDRALVEWGEPTEAERAQADEIWSNR